MNVLMKTFTLLLIAVLANAAQAQDTDPIVVVVNKDNPVEQLSRSDLIDLFMGKYVAFPNDSEAIPVELEGEHEIKVTFYQELVGMSLSRVNAYWSRLRFTGRKRSAVFQSDETEVIDFISSNKQAIGYMPKSLINKNLKVVYILNE